MSNSRIRTLKGLWQSVLFLGWGAILIVITQRAYPIAPHREDLAGFSAFMNRWGNVTFLLLLLIIVWLYSASTRMMDAPPTSSSRLLLRWWVGLLLILTFSLGLSLYVNPHGRLPSKRYPAVTPSARLIKTELYRNLPYTPDIVILGSSLAFSLPPGYVEEKLGHQSFNMAVEAGQLDDYLIEMQFLLQESNQTTPRVIIIELAPRVLARYESGIIESQPITLIRYLPPHMALRAVLGTIRDLFGFQSVSDSLFLLSHAEMRFAPARWTFKPNGEGIRAPATGRRYRILLQRDIETRLDEFVCTSLDPAAQRLFEGLVSTAQSQHIGVVAYMSPVNRALFSALALQDGATAISTCHTLLRQYGASLAEAHPNFFFADLAYYPPVINLKEYGYYDGLHLRPNAARLVIDALASRIQSAYAWSVGH